MFLLNRRAEPRGERGPGFRRSYFWPAVRASAGASRKQMSSPRQGEESHTGGRPLQPAAKWSPPLAANDIQPNVSISEEEMAIHVDQAVSIRRQQEIESFLASNPAYAAALVQKMHAQATRPNTVVPGANRILAVLVIVCTLCATDVWWTSALQTLEGWLSAIGIEPTRYVVEAARSRVSAVLVLAEVFALMCC